MFKAAGMVHKRSHRITDRRVPGVTGFSGHGKIGQAQAADRNRLDSVIGSEGGGKADSMKI